jgi:hypothetical protein
MPCGQGDALGWRVGPAGVRLRIARRSAQLDHLQEVVEVMRHTGGELAEHLETLAFERGALDLGARALFASQAVRMAHGE